MDSYKNVLKMFSPLKILNSLFSKERDFCSFSSILLFSYASFPLFLCSVSLLMMNSEIFESLTRKQFHTFFQMGWKWLHQDL
jgi:hypothetical protein